MSVFRFKQFWVVQADNSMKVGTDAMVLGALIRTEGKRYGLDIGAGTGVLSLMVAQENTSITIDAVEMDELSAKECGINFEKSPWPNRLHMHMGDFLRFNPQRKYDLIFSNPPYYQTNYRNDDAREAKAKHVGEMSPDALLTKVEELLSENGTCWLILPFIDRDSWLSSAKKNQLYPSEEITIIGKEGQSPKRTIIALGRSKNNPIASTLTIRTKDGQYTAGYKELTRSFHATSL